VTQPRQPLLLRPGLAGLVASATAPARFALRLFAVASSAVGEPAELEMLVRARLLD